MRVMKRGMWAGDEALSECFCCTRTGDYSGMVRWESSCFPIHTQQHQPHLHKTVREKGPLEQSLDQSHADPKTSAKDTSTTMSWKTRAHQRQADSVTANSVAPPTSSFLLPSPLKEADLTSVDGKIFPLPPPTSIIEVTTGKGEGKKAMRQPLKTIA